MTDTPVSVIEDDEDDMPAELRAVTEAINDLLGGNAADYALKQLGPNTFSMVFDGADSVFEDIVERLQAVAGVDSAVLIAYPDGANFANIFGDETSVLRH